MMCVRVPAFVSAPVSSQRQQSRWRADNFPQRTYSLHIAGADDVGFAMVNITRDIMCAITAQTHI